MQSMPQYKKGFTLIELLTVIAIIAVLVAILFPIVGTVREQARQSSCITRLHQLWVAASVYKQDEGAYPPTLLGLAERPDGSYVTIASEPHVDVDRLVRGVLYGDQIKDI
ncbi:MAG TPA: prepilin-type N-terminal cleavage/methylation domain-containing protein, partial [Chthonomonadales bacterium]|nr:prepilin-type N-terminal cleavage/methylation domain-containing protein [Chthonomonadales bacterium]